MKVRVTEPGWETFTGQFAEVDFVDGVSTVELSGFQIARLGAAIRIENLDGEQQSPSADLVRHAEMNADEAAGFDAVRLEVAPGKEVKKTYTRAELEEVADKEGIAGLRLIGDLYGIKSRKIVELMDLILKAQGGNAPVDAPVDAPVAAPVEAPVAEPKAEPSPEGDNQADQNAGSQEA